MTQDLLRERARARIRDAIASGALQPGDQIVEAAMAARIRVSRGPVREARRRVTVNHGKTVELTRAYAVCTTCGTGLFPPG